MKVKWTKEAILEDAKKYKTRKEWKANSPNSYAAAQRKGFLNTATSHMEVLWEKKWTEESILEDAKKYSSRKEWKVNSGAAYGAALKKGLIDKACCHMNILWEKKWTEESILEDAKKYSSRKEWQLSSTAYSAAFKKGLLKKATASMPKIVRKTKKWTEEAILEDAKKYSSINEWRKNSAAYGAACKKKLLDPACSHMNKKKLWTEENIFQEAKKYKTITEWCKKSSGAYAAAKRMGVFSQSIKHMEQYVPVPVKWTEQTILKDAKKFCSIKEWREKSGGGYNAALKKGLLKKATAHMTLLVDHNKWTKEAVLENAKKHKTRSEWKKNFSAAYRVAIRNGWAAEACAHMVTIKRDPWTVEEILEDAKKYKTRREWQIKSSVSYVLASKKGLLSQATAHMKKNGGTSKPEQDILALVKQHYPKAHTLRDRKVSIPNKPHIKGFHIDIYIPELRKGIEFNGTYWHSIEGLKRSRKDWPEHDLENYHLLKTEHFSKKGIEILYIDEKEWVTNSGKCMFKILEFLKIG